MERVTAIIPARMASSRFPGKPLAPICGLAMIEHVRRRTLLCDFVDEVRVATCDQEIAEEVRRFGGNAVITSDRHESCVDRIAEAAQDIDDGIIMNVQGDVPLVHPESLKKLITPFMEESDLMFTDMMGPIDDDSQMNSLNVVKVVFDKSNNALYYSRAPIPSYKKGESGNPSLRYKQFGLNAYRCESLRQFTSLQRSPLEKLESIDMIRLIEHGLTVRMVLSAYPSIGVDTPEDLLSVEKLMENDELFHKYKKGQFEKAL